MISKDTITYITQNYNDNLEPIFKLSKSNKGKILVNDERKLYNYDDITKKSYHALKYPTSADSLLVTNKLLEFVEFKSGFKKKITKETFDTSKLICPLDSSKICIDYGKLLLDKQTLETQELLDSLKMKAIESYMTLEKKLLPQCAPQPQGTHVRTAFCVVIDDAIDTLEDTLNELSNEKSNSNSITQIKDSLSRFVNHKDSDGNDYLYDELKVLSPYEFTIHLNQTIT